MTLTLSEHANQVEKTLDEAERGDAYAEGWDAAEAGANPLDNPYSVDSNKHVQWHRGWKDRLNSPESALANQGL